MSDPQTTAKPLERSLLLLADRATQGLSAHQGIELRGLLRQLPELDDLTLDHAAAALELAVALPREALPADLEDALIAQGRQMFGCDAPRQEPQDPPVAEPSPTPAPDEPLDIATALAETYPENRPDGTPLPAPTAAAEPPGAPAEPAVDGFSAPPKKRPRKKASSTTTGNWGWVAAAICLAVAALAWLPRLLSEAPPSAQAQRQQLADQAGSIRAVWKPSASAANTTGHVVWNAREQRGYMQFQELTPNDPSEFQYQLWLIDGARDVRYPVDGGTFNAPISDEPVLIDFAPALPVNTVQRFIVTLEPAGGVVVSDLQRTVLSATP